MALTLTTSGSLNTTVDNYAFSILSNTSSVQLGAVSLKLVVPGGCTIKNVNAGTSSVDSLVFLQQDGNLNIGMYTLSNWVVNTNDVILSITASGMSTGSFTLNTDEDWYCEIASSSAEPFTDFAIKMPSLASPYASVSTTLEAVSILSGVNPSITSVGAPNSSVFGSGSRTLGTASIAEGINTLASGLASHAAGINTTASGQAAFSMGIETDADGMASFAAGSGSLASGIASFAVGLRTTADGLASLTAGTETGATAQGSVAFGNLTLASGLNSFAAGQGSIASGNNSIAMGLYTTAEAEGQVTLGQYNELKSDKKEVLIVGAGINEGNRHNIIEVIGGNKDGGSQSERQILFDVTIADGALKNSSFFAVSGSSIFNGGSTFSGSSVFYGGNTQIETLYVTGNTSLTGKLTANGGITGSLFGTSSWAINALTASFVNTASTNAFVQGGNSFGTTAILGTNDNQNLQLETNNTTRIFISSSGNVGIGKSNPTARLDISGSVITTGSLSVTGSLSLKGPLYDNLGTAGTPDQILFTTSTGVEWRDNIANAAQDLVITGKNVGLTTIPKGTPLYFTGSGTSGNIVGILPADAGNPDRMPAGGVAGEQITAGSEGDVYIYGFISGVNTSAFSSGDDIFVAVGGGYTNTKPTGSAFIQKLGNVEKVDSSNGSGVIQGPSWYNDLPNWEIGRVMVGRSTGQPVTSSLVYLDEANGRLGLGTTSPISTLSVAGGNININDGYSIGGNALGSYVPFLRYNNTGAGVPSSSFGHTTAYITSLGGGVFGTNDLIFYAGGLTQTEIVRIVGSTGFVGIGESSPSAKLEIKGSGATSATTAFRVENSNATASLLVRDDGSSTLGFSYANTHIVTGSVSINQSGSNIPLTVNGRNLTSDTGNKIFEVIGSAGTSVFSPRSNGLVFISTGQLYFEGNGLTSKYYDSRLQLGTSVINTASTSANPELYGGLRVFTWDGSATNTEVFRVAGTGNVSLGFPSTFTNSARLHISGSTSQQLLEIDAGGNVAPVFVVSGSGNIGIGTATPSVRLHLSQSSGTFQRVDINNANADGVNATTEYYTNTGATPDLFGATSFRLQGGTTDAFKQFQVYIANLTSPRFIINGSGNVGINTTSPNARLHISGANNQALLIASSSDAPSALFVSGSGNVGIGVATPQVKLHISGANNDSLFRIQSPASASILFVSGSGNVGIGTTSPTQKLDVIGRGYFSSGLSVGTTSTAGTGLTVGGSAVFLGFTEVQNGAPAYFYSSGNTYISTIKQQDDNLTLRDALYINGSGSVGIGTTSPTARLHISGANNGALLIASSSTAPSALFVSGSGNVGIGTTTPTSLLQVAGRVTSTELYVTNGDAIYTTNGSVGIGTSGPTSTNRLQVRGSGATSATTALRVENSNASASLTILNDGTSAFNTNHLYVSSSGNIGIGTATPTALFQITTRFKFNSDGTANWGVAAANGLLTWDTGKARILGLEGNDLSFGSNAVADQLYIKSGSGNIGIGTTTPTQRLDVRGNTILAETAPINPIGGTLEVYNNGSNAQITIHEDSGSAEARLAFRAGGNDTILRSTKDRFLIDAESKADAIVINTDGRVGIGVGSNAPSSVLQIRGEGATSATTAFRVENSAATARLTILDDGTSAFNTSHLYVSSSGRVAVGTATPQRLFDVYNGANPGIAASFGAQMGNSNFSGISFGYVEPTNALYRKSALVFERTETHGGGSNASGKIHFLLNNNSSTSATAITDAVLTIDSVGTTAGSSRVGIGTRFPTASLHISGTVATDNLMRVQSTTGAEYFFISASGNVGIGTTTPSASLQVQGNFQISTGSLYTYGQNTDIDSGSFRTVVSVSTGSYRAAFFDYVLTSGSNARAGTVFSVWQGTSVEYADTSTNDIGNTTGVNLLVSMSGANIGLFASSSNDNWSMKALARML